MAMNAIDVMFRAFSDRTRLRILHLLNQRETCVGDIVRILRLPQPTASRHLAYLRKAGLVHVRKEGLWAHYSIARSTNRFHQRLLECLNSCFDEVPELAADTARAERLMNRGECCLLG